MAHKGNYVKNAIKVQNRVRSLEVRSKARWSDGHFFKLNVVHHANGKDLANYYWYR